MKIYFETLTHENFDLVGPMFRKIFPEEPHYDLKDFKDSVENTHNYGYLRYYYIKSLEDDAYVGFIGLYVEKGSIDECWIGWFGILPEYRRHGYARDALAALGMLARRELRREVMRVYTDSVINATAVTMYKKAGFRQDSCYTHNFITLVKPLWPYAKVHPWLGIPIGFKSEPPPGVEE